MCYVCVCMILFFFFKQKTAYEMRISDWSSDVCSSDLEDSGLVKQHAGEAGRALEAGQPGQALGRGRHVLALVLVAARHQEPVHPAPGQLPAEARQALRRTGGHGGERPRRRCLHHLPSPSVSNVSLMQALQCCTAVKTLSTER